LAPRASWGEGAPFLNEVKELVLRLAEFKAEHVGKCLARRNEAADAV
jgi:hypothetical protein